MDTPSSGTPGYPGYGMASYADAPAPIGLRKYIPALDIAAVGLWFLLFTLGQMRIGAGIPGLSALRYLLAIYFVSGIVLYPSSLLPIIAKSWIVFVLPVMNALSALWAPSASEAIRQGILMAMTAVVSIFIAGRVSGRGFFYTYFAAEFFAMIVSILHPTPVHGDWVGAFDQKNVLAINMFVLYICGFILMLDSRMSPIYRLAGASSLAPAAFLIVMSHSATTLAFVGAGTLGFIVWAVVWRPASKVPHLRMLLVLMAVLLVSIAAILVFGILEVNAGNSILALLGKDSTLTGRTYLWQQARDVMAAHPWLGVGANGFWRQEHGQANSIIEYFYYKSWVKFSFHNSYYENGVALGYPGFYMTIILATWALFNALRNWVQKQDLFNMGFATLAILIVIRSNTEVDLALEFGNIILLYVAAMRRNEPVAVPDLSQQNRPETLHHAFRQERRT